MAGIQLGFKFASVYSFFTSDLDIARLVSLIYFLVQEKLLKNLF